MIVAVVMMTVVMGVPAVLNAHHNLDPAGGRRSSIRRHHISVA